MADDQGFSALNLCIIVACLLAFFLFRFLSQNKFPICKSFQDTEMDLAAIVVFANKYLGSGE